MGRADEIAQGLRDESGALTFPLDVLDYCKGHDDYRTGMAPPRVTSASYDLGRNRAREGAEAKQDLMDRLAAEQAERNARVREILKDRPDLLAEYDVRMAEIASQSGDAA